MPRIVSRRLDAPDVAELRLAGSFDAEIVETLDRREAAFGKQGRERYSVLIATAVEDVAKDLAQSLVEWRRLSWFDVGVCGLASALWVDHQYLKIVLRPEALGTEPCYMVFRSVISAWNRHERKRQVHSRAHGEPVPPACVCARAPPRP